MRRGVRSFFHNALAGGEKIKMKKRGSRKKKEKGIADQTKPITMGISIIANFYRARMIDRARNPRRYDLLFALGNRWPTSVLELNSP